VPPPEQDDDAFLPTGPTLGMDGNLEGTAPAPRPRAPSRPRPTAPEVLELAERPPPPPTDYVPPPSPPPARVPSRVPRSLFALLLLAGLGAGGWFLRGYLPTVRSAAAVVLINSEPSGAMVRVQGTEVGTTPWAADNLWGPGPVEVEVSRPGYRTWSGSFRGGGAARLDVRLQKR
jgi:eukaryotic-like serine/threonine-protein kinase